MIKLRFLIPLSFSRNDSIVEVFGEEERQQALPAAFPPLSLLASNHCHSERSEESLFNYLILIL